MNTEIRKSKGIDILVRDYSPDKVEKDNPVTIVGENIYRELMKEYRKHLSTGFQFQDCKKFVRGEIQGWTDAVLSPPKIDHFLQLTSIDRDWGYQYKVGPFIARLIQNSYNAGHNNFILSTYDLPKIRDLGYFSGTEENPLCIQTKGDLDSYYGVDVQYASLTIEGDVDLSFGYRAKDSTFTFNGQIPMDEDIRAENCTFRTTRRDTLEILQMLALPPYSFTKRTARNPLGNKIIFIHEDGREELVADNQ